MQRGCDHPGQPARLVTIFRTARSRPGARCRRAHRDTLVRAAGRLKLGTSSCWCRILPTMSRDKRDGKDAGEKLAKVFDDWQVAEVKYATALAEFVKDGQPKKVTKSSALKLAELRGVADSRMGTFFKKAVG